MEKLEVTRTAVAVYADKITRGHWESEVHVLHPRMIQDRAVDLAAVKQGMSELEARDDHRNVKLVVSVNAKTRFLGTIEDVERVLDQTVWISTPGEDPERPLDYVELGNVRVKGDLQVEGALTALPPQAQEPKEMWVAMMGNPADGFQLYGPFDSAVDASEWGSNDYDEWWTMQIHPAE